MHASCSHCHKTSAELTTALKQCGKCHRQPYCSRECQVAHWPTHKSACSTGTANAAPKADEAPKATSAFNMEAFLNAIASSQSQQPSASQSRPSNTSRSSSATFGDETTAGGSLFGKGLLDPSHPEGTIYKHLIDCFRLRCEDQYSWAGEHYGIFNEESPFPEFGTFLPKAQGKGLLPSWWGKSKRKACLRVAGDTNGRSCIWHAVEKSDIQDMYLDAMMPMRLRSLANQIYREGVESFGMW